MLKPQLATAIAVVACAAAPMYAQGGISQQFARAGLTQGDIDIMAQRAEPLYQNGGAQVGADTVWRNNETDAYGLAEVTTVQGNCVGIAYRFITTKRAVLQTIEVRYCQENGNWVLSG